MEDSVTKKIDQLKEKYSLTGQKLDSYLEGLLLSNYLSYWDYIHLDTLLSLQNPKTDFPDEKIFIVYHQITELYFNLCLHELTQIANNGINIQENGEKLGFKEKLDADFFYRRLLRINRYFESLTKSFEIMIEGMEPEQFLKYRMALLPASGFQSAQYRKIEIACTPIYNLIDKDVKAQLDKAVGADIAFEHVYWKQGAKDVSTGQKTYTLQQFEKKYATELLSWTEEYSTKNVWVKYKELSTEDQANENVINQLKELDVNVNIKWPLVHYKSAVRYLQSSSEKAAEATGGTNWQKYLPPRFQKRIFFPELWSEDQIKNWGTTY